MPVTGSYRCLHAFILTERNPAMANETRTPGKYGLIPHDPARFAPRLENYVRGPLRVTGLPPANGDIDRCSKITDWGMQGNDEWGDCVEAMVIHADEAMNAYAGHAVTYSSSYGPKLYSQITGFDPNAGPPGDNPTDQGTNIQDALEFWKNTGLKDASGKTHKLAGYAQFGNPADETLLGQVLDVFGCVLVGVALQQDQEDQFSAGEPWDYVPGDPFIGGHGIPLQRRRAGGIGTLEYVTWGAVTKATRSFQYHCAGQGNGEAWAVVTSDWVAANGTTIEGLDLEQLLADLQFVPQG